MFGCLLNSHFDLLFPPLCKEVGISLIYLYLRIDPVHGGHGCKGGAGGGGWGGEEDIGVIERGDGGCGVGREAGRGGEELQALQSCH